VQGAGPLHDDLRGFVVTEADRRAHQDVVELTPLVRRVIGSKVRDPNTTDDLTQETLARVIHVRERLADEALPAYAAATARNLVYSLHREEQRHARHAHRLIDLVERHSPEEEALRREDIQAIKAAVEQLSERERREVLAHEVMGQDTSSIAQTARTTPGAIAVRLAGTRAKLRVDYLLALQKKGPPTAKCRSVLVALSSGNRRRQEALRAGEHLASCDFCLALSDPVVQRRRPLAALWPLPALFELKGMLAAWFAVAKKYILGVLHGAWKFIGTLLPTPAAKIAAATVATLVTGSVIAGGGGSDERPSSLSQPPALGLTVDGRPVSPKELANRARLTSARVRGTNVPVLSDLGDEGFWVGRGNENRIWVEITSNKGESQIDVDADDQVAFVGTVTRHTPRYAKSVGVKPFGEAVLRAQANHIEVRVEDLKKA
jgi:RNA polymerase sigma factor (sigma-70 family)